jgi:hypothetical protein
MASYDTHHTDDGLPPGEGAFLACTFWLVDAYAMCAYSHVSLVAAALNLASATKPAEQRSEAAIVK